MESQYDRATKIDKMDALKDGIGLRAYAQKDPLVEYQREGFSMFATMKNAIKEETLGFLFNARPTPS